METIKEQQRIIDYRQTEIGRQNWEVCARMLIHDLLDISKTNPEVKKVLDFYSIHYTDNGGYTMALPRLKVLERNAPQETKPEEVKPKRRRPKGSKGKKK